MEFFHIHPLRKMDASVSAYPYYRHGTLRGAFLHPFIYT